jgi:hypothetical protein
MQVDGAACHQPVKAGQVLDFQGAGAGTKASGEVHSCRTGFHIMEPA